MNASIGCQLNRVRWWLFLVPLWPIGWVINRSGFELWPYVAGGMYGSLLFFVAIRSVERPSLTAGVMFLLILYGDILRDVFGSEIRDRRSFERDVIFASTYAMTGLLFILRAWWGRSPKGEAGEFAERNREV